MKNIIPTTLILLLFAVPALTSCDDFLSRDPLSNYSNQSLGIDETDLEERSYTASEIESFLNGAYGDFKTEYFQLDFYLIGEAQSDNAHAGADNPNMFELEEWRVSATNEVVDRTWGYLYGMISKTNTVIENVDKVSGLSDAQRDRILGEASFIRAWAYFDVIRMWNNIPIITSDVSGINAENIEEVYEILYPYPSSAEEAYELILEDLDVALPRVRTSAPDKGYATRGAVLGLMARVHAELGNWSDVITYSSQVMSGNYALLSDFEALWNGSVENSPESIFEVNYYGWDTGGNWGVFMFQGTDWKKFNTPTYDLVRAYQAEGDDIRLASTIHFRDVSGMWTDRHWNTSTYPFVNKYRNETGSQNFILMRLADIMLLKAEAHARLGQINNAMSLVNEVRDRVELPPVSASTQQEALEQVLRERRLELAFEGQRFFDLRRSGRALEIMQDLRGADGTPFSYHIAEFRLLWPIPQSELDKNPRLQQNLGY